MVVTFIDIKWLLGSQQLPGNKQYPCQDKHVLSGNAAGQAVPDLAAFILKSFCGLTGRLRGSSFHVSWHAWDLE